MYDRFGIVFAIWSDLLMDLTLFWGPFFNRFLQFFVLKPTADKQGSDEKSAKICQDPPRSNEINQAIAKHKPPQTPHARTNHENAKPQN